MFYSSIQLIWQQWSIFEFGNNNGWVFSFSLLCSSTRLIWHQGVNFPSQCLLWLSFFFALFLNLAYLAPRVNFWGRCLPWLDFFFVLFLNSAYLAPCVNFRGWCSPWSEFFLLCHAQSFKPKFLKLKEMRKGISFPLHQDYTDLSIESTFLDARCSKDGVLNFPTDLRVYIVPAWQPL